MSWDAEIVWIGPPGDRVEVAVKFTQDAQSVTHRYVTDGTLASLRPQVQRTAAQLAKPLDLTEGQAIDTTPDPIKPVDPPTQEQLDRIAFVGLVREMKKLQAALDLKLATQEELDTAIVSVKTAFQSGFEDLL